MMTLLFSALLCEVTFRRLLTAMVFRGKTIETVFGHQTVDLTVAINEVCAIVVHQFLRWENSPAGPGLSPSY